MIKRAFVLTLAGLVFLVNTTTIYAVCPVCTVAIGAGLGLSRYFGVDDLISGIWIGGLILSFSFWLINWLKKRNFTFMGMTGIVLVLMYILIILPLWWGGILGHPFNKLWGIDKLIIGIFLGTVMLMFALWLDKTVRKIYGHQLFIYQKVVFPVTTLMIASLAIYFLPK